MRALWRFPGVEPPVCLDRCLVGRYPSIAKSYKVLTDMRNTKVYSITMPPEMAKRAERLARKENRTMSELVREALRRYEQPMVNFNLREYRSEEHTSELQSHS